MVEGFLAFLSYLEAIVNPGNITGLLALFFLATFTDIGIPTPFILDTVLLLTSYRTGPFSMQVWLIVLMLLLGRQVGAAMLYWLSRYPGGILLNWLTKYFPNLPKRLEIQKEQLTHWTPLAIATGRLTPGLLQMTSIAAGVIRVRYTYFVLGVAIASLAYDGMLIVLGFIAAHNPRAADISFTIWVIIGILILVFVLWPLTYYLIQRSRKISERL